MPDEPKSGQMRMMDRSWQDPPSSGAAILNPPLGRISFDPADKLRRLAAEYQSDGYGKKAAELEIIADALEALALRGMPR